MSIADKPLPQTDNTQPHDGAALVPKSLSEKPPVSAVAPKPAPESGTIEITSVDSIFAGIDNARTAAVVKPADANGFYSDQQIEKLWDQAVAANGGKPLQMAKGYTEVRAERVENPNGVLASSTDSQMKLKTDLPVTTTDGKIVTLPAGAVLPAGIEFSPKSAVTENADTTRTITGADLKVTSSDHKLSITLADGRRVEIGEQTIGGTVTVADGSKVPADAYTIARDSIDPKTGEKRVDAYYNKNEQAFRLKWQDVPGKPGVFSPQPSQMGDARELVQVPAGYDGKMIPNYGGYRDKPVDLKSGDLVLIQRDADGKIKEMYRVEEGAAVETYTGIDAAGKRALADSAAKMRDLGGSVVPAAATGDEFRARELAAAAAAAPVVAETRDVHARDGETTEVTQFRLALDKRTDIPDYDKETIRQQLERLADPQERADLERQIKLAMQMSEADKAEADHHTRVPKRGGWTGILSLSPQALDLLARALGI